LALFDFRNSGEKSKKLATNI
jgi:hypothetical protein